MSKKLTKKIKGTTIESLIESRAIRAEFLKDFGYIPTSILVHNRGQANCTIDLAKDKRGGGYAAYERKKQNSLKKQKDYIPGMEKTAFKFQGRKNYLSSFPQEPGRVILKVFCPDNGIVYDPFAGHNSRMELCYMNGHSYVGVDVSSEFMKANRKIRKILKKRNERQLLPPKKKRFIKLIEGSSHNVELPSNYADFTITSPPYWDIEYYGDEEEQLGNCKTYKNFLKFLKRHVVENFRILKPGAFACWFINDFRKNGVFLPYHIDLYRLFVKCGFIAHYVYIVDLGHAVNSAFVQDIISKKLLPKHHEFCLVFKKPEEKINA